MCKSSRKFLAEVEGRYVRQVSSIDHYAIVKLRIYMIDTDAVLFEKPVVSVGTATPRFAQLVLEKSTYYAAEHNISRIQVCLFDRDGKNMSSEWKFILAR